MFNLENKIIVVTGGKGLLGKKMIEYLQKAGAIAICADLSISDNKIEEHQYNLNITDTASIHSFINLLLKKYGKIDGWVNNAYPRTADWGKKVEEIHADSWQKNVDMHMNGYFFCCQHVLEQMKKQKFGSVINMASIYGVVGPDFTIYEGTAMTMPAAYSAIKGGIVTLTKYLASYYGAYNIRVNAISPGGIFDNQPPSFVTQYEKKVPLKRMGTPEDIAPTVVFLCSNEAAYITGHNLVVDGGWTAV